MMTGKSRPQHMYEYAPVLIDGSWRRYASVSGPFTSKDPATGRGLAKYPISGWDELDQALTAAEAAYKRLEVTDPTKIARFLDTLANHLDMNADELVQTAVAETALSRVRLQEVEVPRTVLQLRQAARSVASRSWRDPILDPEAHIASFLAPIPGAVVVIGPNNFPFAFNGVGGGDFAAAVATGHPVIAKANPGHPGTTRMLAEIARLALRDADLPSATVQLVYAIEHDDGYRLVADRRVAATAFTGSRSAGLRLKAAADAAGRPIYLEMSSLNPVVLLPGALRERMAQIASDLSESMLAASGQFCTSPGLLFVQASVTDQFIRELGNRLAAAPIEPLLGDRVRDELIAVVDYLERNGARVVYRSRAPKPMTGYPTTLLMLDGSEFEGTPTTFQREAFGNAAVIVRYNSIEQLGSCLSKLEGNLTGSIYVSGRSDEDDYARISPILRECVGRLLNNRMPTGVRVVPAMNHGGPYPATGHPGFSAVGIPVSFRRFAMLQCFDNVDDHRLPPELQAANPLGVDRTVAGRVTQNPIQWGRPA